MTACNLAWRTAVQYKARTLLAITGIAIISALNFDMLLLSRGLLLSFADMIESAGFDVRVMGGEGLSVARRPVRGATRLAGDIRRLPEVEDVALFQVGQAVASVAHRSDQVVTLVGTTESPARSEWTLLRGTNLSSANQPVSVPAVVVSGRLASLVGLNVGSTIRLRGVLPLVASALPAVDCRVVGIADFHLEAMDEYTVATTTEGFRIVRGQEAADEADMLLVASRTAVGPTAAAAAIARMRPDLRVMSNDQLVAQFNQNGFAYFRQVSRVLSTTTALFTLMLVATLLTVSVNQRLAEIAALRALGVGARWIASTLLWESVLFVGTGGLAALPLGGLLAVQLDRILRSMPGLPERLHFFVFEPRALLWQASLLAATAVVSALYPMWLVATVPIAETLRREVLS